MAQNMSHIGFYNTTGRWISDCLLSVCICFIFKTADLHSAQTKRGGIYEKNREHGSLPAGCFCRQCGGFSMFFSNLLPSFRRAAHVHLLHFTGRDSVEHCFWDDLYMDALQMKRNNMYHWTSHARCPFLKKRDSFCHPVHGRCIYINRLSRHDTFLFYDRRPVPKTGRRSFPHRFLPKRNQNVAVL